MTAPAPRFDHLLRMADRRGTFKHACFAESMNDRRLIATIRHPDTAQSQLLIQLSILNRELAPAGR